jgi:hypothetical protein
MRLLIGMRLSCVANDPASLRGLPDGIKRRLAATPAEPCFDKAVVPAHESTWLERPHGDPHPVGIRAMIRLAALAALALGSWAAVHAVSSPSTPDRLVIQMADPALGRATPDQVQAVMGGRIRFDPAPADLAAPSCAVSLPIQPDGTVADGVAGFASDPDEGACATPHLRHLALRLTTTGAFTQAHVVDLLRDELGAPDESEATADGTTRVSWLGTDRARYVEYDPKMPDTTALFLIQRPAVSSL